MSHEEYKEMLALAALDLLDEADSAKLSAHLATCEECRVSLRELRNTTALLARSVAPVMPPDEIRDALLRRVQGVSQQPQVTVPDAQHSGHSTANQVDSQANRQVNQSHLDSSAPILTNAPPPFATSNVPPHVFSNASAYKYGLLAALVILVTCLLSIGVLWKRLGETQAELVSVRRAQSAQEQLVREQSAREQVERERATTELLRSPETRLAVLHGTRQAPRAHARLVLNHRSGEATLFSFDLPPAPAGKAYQLWFIANGKPLPGSVFTTDATGRAELREQIPVEGRTAADFAVTLESATGSPNPTSGPYLTSAAS